MSNAIFIVPLSLLYMADHPPRERASLVREALAATQPAPKIAQAELLLGGETQDIDQATKEIRGHVSELRLKNKQSDNFVQELSQKASNTGAICVGDIASVGSSGSKPRN